MKRVICFTVAWVMLVFLVGCNLSQSVNMDESSLSTSKPVATSKSSIESKTNSVAPSSADIVSTSESWSDSSSSVSSKKPVVSSQSGVGSSKYTSSKVSSSTEQNTEPNDSNFDPEHKEGYIYIPGEGYIKIEEDSGASGEQAMGGKDFWEILNDPENEIIGY